MGGAQACDLHGAFGLHIKLGIAAHVHPSLEDAVFLKQNQMWCLLYS